MREKQDKHQEYKKFIDEHKEALRLLADKVKTVDTVRGVATLQEMRGRQLAIRIIDEWLNEMWGISTDTLPPPEEDDELFKYVE